jgi:hypothetical protein
VNQGALPLPDYPFMGLLARSEFCEQLVRQSFASAVPLRR